MRRDMTLRLSYPLFCSQREAIAFAESKAGWILKTRERLEERKAEKADEAPAKKEEKAEA